MAALVVEQKTRLLLAAVLIGRFGSTLSDFERDTVEQAILRWRDRGDSAVVTDREWAVIEEAVGAMEALRDDAARDATRIVGHVAAPSSLKGAA